MRAEPRSPLAVGLLAVALVAGTVAGCTSPRPVDEGAPQATSTTTVPTDRPTADDVDDEATAAGPPSSTDPSASPTPDDDAASSSSAPEPTATATATSTSDVSPEPEETSPGTGESAGADPGVGAAVVVVSWSAGAPDGSVQASGYVQVLEQGGTCRLEVEAVDGATSFTEQEATPDASTTSCGELTVPADRAGEGPWRARLSYDSASTTGTSAWFEIGVS